MSENKKNNYASQQHMQNIQRNKAYIDALAMLYAMPNGKQDINIDSNGALCKSYHQKQTNREPI